MMRVISRCWFDNVKCIWPVKYRRQYYLQRFSFVGRRPAWSYWGEEGCLNETVCALLLLTGHGRVQHGVQHLAFPVCWYQYSLWWTKSRTTTSLALNR